MDALVATASLFGQQAMTVLGYTLFVTVFLVSLLLVLTGRRGEKVLPAQCDREKHNRQDGCQEPVTYRNEETGAYVAECARYRARAASWEGYEKAVFKLNRQVRREAAIEYWAEYWRRRRRLSG